MNEIFKTHLEKFIKIDEREFGEILKFFRIQSVPAKQNLLEEGKVCRDYYFVLKGILRLFFLNEKGVEQTTEFAIETWWITDNMAYEHGRPSSFSIQAIEKTAFLSISRENQENLLREFPKMEHYFRLIYQRAYAASQMRMKYFLSYSKEEFYFSFVKSYPEFVQRVPQYLIASYLGFTPEYLSEIRKRQIS